MIPAASCNYKLTQLHYKDFIFKKGPHEIVNRIDIQLDHIQHIVTVAVLSYIHSQRRK